MASENKKCGEAKMWQSSRKAEGIKPKSLTFRKCYYIMVLLKTTKIIFRKRTVAKAKTDRKSFAKESDRKGERCGAFYRIRKSCVSLREGNQRREEIFFLKRERSLLINDCKKLSG